MTIPETTPEKIEEAIKIFNDNYKHKSEWLNWEKNKTYKYALEYRGKKYPPKKIISIATGKSVSYFSSGNKAGQAVPYLEKLGFNIISIQDSSPNNTFFLKEAFKKISQEYPDATKETMKGHSLALFIRRDAKNAVKGALGSGNSDLVFKSGHGQYTSWATIPWIAVFEPSITKGAKKGFYPVYLFSADMKTLFLSLNQGVSKIEQDYGRSRSFSVLQSRSHLMKTRVGKDIGAFNDTPIDLLSEALPAKAYAAGHAIGKSYKLSSLPSNDELAQDLINMVRIYRILIARGGTDTFSDDGDTDEKTYTEKKQLKYHKRIERNNARLIARVKEVHDKYCEGCKFDFGQTYGDFAEGYIEAHHLIPFSELPEDIPVPKDPKTDFAVLCANCHRMMHRKDGPKSIPELRTILNNQK